MAKYVSVPTSPTRLVEQPEEKGKKKERCEVGEGSDAVVIESGSDDDEDEETLQQRFQLRSRFRRAGMPDVPVIIEKPSSLEASLPVPPRRPRNVARKHTVKKLKISETTNQEVNTATRVVEHS